VKRKSLALANEVPMKAVAYQKPLPIADAQSLLDVNLPEPVPGERDHSCPLRRSRRRLVAANRTPQHI